jgi:peptidoglycan/xylan/chitin deacetylase (PgdA/CDA1 family)
MRAALGLLLAGLLPPAPRASAAAGAARDLPIIVYHEIRASGAEPADGPTVISLKRFNAQMRFLRDRGYATLGMDDVMRFLRGEPFPEKIVAIQFDDGWKSQLSAAPALKRLGFKATFWIIAGGMRADSTPHMDWDEIRALAKNPRFDVHSHTMTHPWKDKDTLVDWVEGRAPGKGIADARWELARSKRLLEEKLGRPAPYLAWPRGLYNDALIALAKEAGYRALLNTDSGFSHPGDDPLRIPRTVIDGRCGDDVFRRVMAEGWARACPDAR